jgi:hypothetical protein
VEAEPIPGKNPELPVPEPPASSEAAKGAEAVPETPPAPGPSAPPVSLPAPAVPPTPSAVPAAPELIGPEPALSAPPLTVQEIKEAEKSSLTSSFRWLGEWWNRHLQKLPGAPASRKGGAELALLEVLVPRDSGIKANAADQFFAAIAGLKSKVGLSFEIVADHEHIHFIVVVPRELQPLVEKQLHAAYSSAEIREIPEYDIFQREGFVAFDQIVTTGPKYYPIKTYTDLGEETDSLNTITSALTKLALGEAAVIQFAVSPADTGWQKQGNSFLLKAKESERKPEGERKILIGKESEEAIARKINKPGFYALIRIVTVSPNRESAGLHLSNIVTSLSQFSSPQLASFSRKRAWFKKSFMVDFLYRHVPRFLHWTVFSSEEIATLFHLPNKFVTTPTIKWLGAKAGAVPLDLPTAGLYLGLASSRGTEMPVYLQKDDRRRHTYIIGQTGTGKSELLKFMAYQDILAGEGLCFIDPHGDAVEDLLQMIPEERVEDVIYFDPGDPERPPALNILEAETEEGKHLAVNSFISLLYKLYDPNRTGVLGPRLERAVRNVMLTAMSEKGNTLIEVFRLLTDPGFAAGKIPTITDPIVKKYWTDELAQTSDFHKSETLGYFVSKFDRFVTEKLMRNIIGQGRSSFNFREVMDRKKILLVNLSKGKIGEENSNFLGLILVPRILTAAMSRVDTPEEQRPDFNLYVDEFQNFATPDFVQILSEARKYRLDLTVANQFIGQLAEDIKRAVFGNVGTKVLFRVGAEDAEFLEKEIAPDFSQSDLLNAAIGQAYVRLLISGVPSIPFTMKTDWARIQALPRDPQKAIRIKDLSRTKYTRPAAEVEEEIKRRAGL